MKTRKKQIAGIGILALLLAIFIWWIPLTTQAATSIQLSSDEQWIEGLSSNMEYITQSAYDLYGGSSASCADALQAYLRTMTFTVTESLDVTGNAGQIGHREIVDLTEVFGKHGKPRGKSISSVNQSYFWIFERG